MCDYKQDIISVREVMVVLYKLILNTHSYITHTNGTPFLRRYSETARKGAKNRMGTFPYEVTIHHMRKGILLDWQKKLSHCTRARNDETLIDE